MNESEDDRSGDVPLPDQDVFSLELHDVLTDTFAEALDLTVDEVRLRLVDGLKFWQIAQEELPHLEDVEDACAGVLNDTLLYAVKTEQIEPSRASDLREILYCTLFPAAEMGDSVRRETRMPVPEYA